MEWVDLAKWAIQYCGFPAACLFGLAWGVWRAIQWIATVLLQPLVERHIRFLDSLDARSTEQTLTLQKQTLVLAKIEARLERLDRRDQAG